MLGPTVAWDPGAFPYLSALTGADEGTTAGTHTVWLEAQLASDGLLPSPQPAVCLLPLGHRWFVVHLAGESLCVDRARGQASPVAALRMATHRNRAAFEALLAMPEPAHAAGAGKGGRSSARRRAEASVGRSPSGIGDVAERHDAHLGTEPAGEGSPEP